MHKIAQKLYRREVQDGVYGDSFDRNSKKALFFTTSGILIVMFLPLFLGQLNNWKTSLIEVNLPKSDWKTHYGYSSTNCPPFKSAPCLANPKNPKLWKGETNVADAGHREKVVSMGSNEWWIGRTISVEQQTRARFFNAEYLYLGWIRGDHSIWINGNFVHKGKRQDSRPIVIPLHSFFKQDVPNPLHVAVKVVNNDHHLYVDLFNGSEGEGIVSASTLEHLIDKNLFWSKIRPYSLFILNIVLAIGFFMFWWGTSRPEIFYFASMCLVASMVQVRLMDLFFLNVDYNLIYKIGFSLRVLEALTVTMLAFSFARLRKDVSRTFAITFIAFAIGIPLFSSNVTTVLGIENWFSMFIIPIFYALGAGVNFVQGFHLFESNGVGVHHPKRGKQLMFFSFVLAVMTIYYIFNANEVIGPLQNSVGLFHYHSSQMIFTLFFANIIIREFREKEILLKSVPVSTYHTRPMLPEALKGLLVAVDLKASKRLFNKRAAGGSGANIVATWRELISQAAVKSQGTVLSLAGDKVLVFFEKKSEKETFENVFNFYDNIVENVKLLKRECRLRFVSDNSLRYFPFHFRASFVEAELSPVWENAGDYRLPSWKEQGGQHSFEAVHQMLDYEKIIPNYESKSIVLFSKDFLANLVEQVPELERNIRFTDYEKIDKHGERYYMAGYEVENGETSELSAPDEKIKKAS